MSGRRNLTQIPADVEYYPMEHVVNLLRVIAAERDELYVQLQNEQAKSATAAAAAAAAAAYPTHHPQQQQQLQHHPQLVQHHQPTPPTQPHHHHHHHHTTIPTATTTPTTTTTTEAFGFPFTETTADTATHALVAATVTPPTPNEHSVPNTFKVDAVKKRIAKKSYTIIKKTPHNKAKKPYTELNEAVPNAAAALALFEGFEPKSDTNRLTKWDLTGDEVVRWLHDNSPKHKYIHPVKFDGKSIAFGGSKPFVYAWAGYDSLQAKFDKKGASLSLKFRTKMVGSGRPDEGSDSPPSLS